MKNMQSDSQIIPERKRWLPKDPEALKSLQKGLKDAKENKLHIMDPNEFDV